MNVDAQVASEGSLLTILSPVVPSSALQATGIAANWLATSTADHAGDWIPAAALNVEQGDEMLHADTSTHKNAYKE